MDHKFYFTADKVRHRIELVENNLFREMLPLDSWNYHEIDQAFIDHANIPTDDSQGWIKISPHSYWGDWQTNFILKLRYQIPLDWDSSSPSYLYLPLGEAGDFFSHPEMLITCNGEKIGSADRHHHYVALPSTLLPGQNIDLVASGWTGHSSWPPEPGLSTKLYMRPCYMVKRDNDAFNLVNLARSALETSELSTLDEVDSAKFLDVLNDALLEIDWAAPLRSEKYFQSVSNALVSLEKNISSVGSCLNATIHAIGHAHIDLAYLWRLKQTDGKLLRTFTNVIRMMEADPEYTFTQTTPYLYERCAEIAPDLFTKIKHYAEQGRWEVATQSWVEMDCNLTGGESLIKQLQLAKSFNQAYFNGLESKILFLPDTFGFCGSLPQLLQQAGVEGFVFSKLNWNQTNKFPHSFFNWRGIDGSEIFSHLLTTPRNVAYLPTPSTYKAEMNAFEVFGSFENSTERHAPVMIAYGYGDGGGGPNDVLLSSAKAFKRMPHQPQLVHSRLDSFISDAKEKIKVLPEHHGELYLELHRGTYTSQAKIKRFNRRLENKLLQVEALMAILTWHQVPIAPEISLRDLWKKFCLNQFHDILPGSAITEVFDDATREYLEIESDLEALISMALSALNKQRVSNTGKRLQYSPFKGWFVSDKELEQSISVTKENYVKPYLDGEVYILENRFVRVEIGKDGNIERITHASLGEFVPPNQPANIFVAYVDRPLMWDAWDIDPFYQEQFEMLNRDNPKSRVSVIQSDDGVTLKIDWQNSSISQKIQLPSESDSIEFQSNVDWKEKNILLKVEFPVAIHSDFAKYHIPFGSIERTTRRDDAIGRAQYEVPAHFWASINDNNKGLALINDCKYGYSVDRKSYGNKLALSLIKSSVLPDPHADQGSHEFQYKIVPHDIHGESKVWESAYNLNRPADFFGNFPSKILPVSGHENLILEGVFWSSQTDGLVMRYFEPFGTTSVVQLKVDEKIPHIIKSDIMESAQICLEVVDGSVLLDVRAFEVITLIIPKTEFTQEFS